ncbi:hypothetical protein CPB86DRAFT_663678, partial [Serendipita vermifera]
CPELDILMIMLERRNLLQGPGIKRIKTISLHTTCSLTIQRIISTLLGSRWAKRPSNRDLSLAGNADILLDLALPGCYMCHRGLRYCNTTTKNAQTEDNREILIDGLQVYPEDEDEILSSWNDGALLW